MCTADARQRQDADRCRSSQPPPSPKFSSSSAASCLTATLAALFLCIAPLSTAFSFVDGSNSNFRIHSVRGGNNYQQQAELTLPPNPPTLALHGSTSRNNCRTHTCLEAFPSSEKSDTSNPLMRVCIAGGGFAGLNTALTLSSLSSDIRITLVDKKERFVFLPLLYELCVNDASVDEVAPTFQSLLKDSRVEFVQGRVSGVNVDDNCLLYSNKRGESMALEYDALVVSTGIEADCAQTPGADELALKFSTIEDCYGLRKQLTLLESRAAEAEPSPLDVVVVGGSYSGVELALNLKERLDKSLKGKVCITLVHRGSEVLPNASTFNKDSAKERLKEAAVDVLTNASVLRVTSAAQGGDDSNISGVRAVHIEQGTRGADSSPTEIILKTDLLLWTAGSNPPNDGVLNSSLPRDTRGRIVTGRSLKVKGTSNVFAIGDVSRTTSSNKPPFPATAQVAIQQAPVAAWNVCTVLKNSKLDAQPKEKLLPFRYVELGEMMTLGSNDATISSLGGLVQVNGPAASVMRRLIYAIRMPTARQRLNALADSASSRVLQTISDKKATRAN